MRNGSGRLWEALPQSRMWATEEDVQDVSVFCFQCMLLLLCKVCMLKNIELVDATRHGHAS